MSEDKNKKVEDQEQPNPQAEEQKEVTPQEGTDASEEPQVTTEPISEEPNHSDDSPAVETKKASAEVPTPVVESKDTPAKVEEVASTEADVETQIEEASDVVTEENKAESEEAAEPEVAASSETSEEKSEDEAVEAETTENAETVEEVESETEEEEEELPDYTTFTREQLVESIEELTQQESFKRADRVLKEIEPLFAEFESNLRKEAEEKFNAEVGEEEEGFEFRHDELFNRFDASLRLLRDRKASYYKEREANKTRNLEKKQELLERLRSLVDGEEATTSLKPIKEVQEVWKAIGPVPNQYNKTLWANYNALLDRFYHNRHILFELKDLDRKKNQVAKTELCEKAEALGKLENVKDAVIQLNELHEEYKRIGAVPREVQEELWKRFKAASDVIYQKRKGFLEHLKGDLKENLGKKKELIEELGTFSSFNSDRINDWNAKTKEILDLQKRWEAIGGVPRENAKEINRSFWSTFKGFFANKNEFFKKLESLRKENLAKKEALVEEAVALQESEDWDKTAEQLKQLQRRWKEVGPVPEKQRNAVYAKFKEACDVFFNNKRQQLNQTESAYVENQEKKEAVLAEIAEKAKGGTGSQEELMQMIAAYNEIGFVPRGAIKSIEAKLQEVVKAYIDGLGLEASEAESLTLRAELSGGNKGGGADRKFQKKESALRRKISELEDNISLWNNNLAFFANSKTADKLKAEFDEKISKAEEEVQSLKKQLRILRSI
ncbi:DUF349 domain-containing protein [Roseivirga sp. E12]|uniref:DUF349 domain-containing protein n=1 Tax=Roseivirga sp. E12 TaxID=2819237 RepID=UPI001ABD174D|nr:DUF349 domain-containing protein [Roseivirga sp. E12]MBO3697094.1 DUF349 domain-containing protein [Roseivirga sp. E12]